MKSAYYNLFLVEDNELDRLAFEKLIADENLPYNYTAARSIAEAERVLSQMRFDVVVTDYRLGDGTGFDILKMVKHCPVILVTGTGDEEVAVNAWRAGAYDYLIKDLDRNYLKAVPITIENAVAHRRTEDNLRLLSGAVMSTDESVYVTDMDDKVLFVNKAFCRTYGYASGEILGKNSSLLWIAAPQSENTRTVFEIRGKDGKSEMGYYHKRKDGGVFPVALSRSIIKDESGRDVAIVGIARDISDRLSVEEELRTTNDKLRDRSRLTGEIGVTMSRQLVEYIAQLRGGIDDAIRECERDSKTARDLERALLTLNRTDGMIANFLAISQIGAAKIQLEIEEFDLVAAARKITEACIQWARQAKLRLNFEAPDYEVKVHADRARTEQVIANLIWNAMETVQADAHITVKVKDMGQETTVEVLDDGPARQDSTTGRVLKCPEPSGRHLECLAEGSLPLALSTSKELVEMHGGCLWLESHEKRGNNLCFMLPKAGPQKVVSASGATQLNPG